MINESEKIKHVELVPYDSNWPMQFEQEAQKIKLILGRNAESVHHIGSTAIPGIYAKPLIDILVVVESLTKADALNSEFTNLGYRCMGEYGIQGRRYYWKSATKRTHHIHLFVKGHSEIKRYLAFRDYIREHPDMAQGYSWVKRCLARQFFNNIEAYVNGKESFIRAIDYFAGAPTQDQLRAQDNLQLLPYNTDWPKLAAAEMEAIKHTIDLPYIAIEHAGSTAVHDLNAKPIIDIFIALESMAESDRWIAPLKALGYVDWPDNPDKTHDRYFKGMPPFGMQRTHHVHIMAMGSDFNKRIAFRNLLQQNSDLRQQYEKLKQSLVVQYPNDREQYTNGKTHFIQQALQDTSRQ